MAFAAYIDVYAEELNYASEALIWPV